MFGWAFPQFSDENDARKIARGQAAGAAVICAVVTAAVALLSAGGNKLFKDLGIGSEALIDAAILLAIAVGIFFMSRTAAVIGFVYYIGNQLYMMSITKRFSFVMIVFAVAFMNGIRSTFAYHTFKKERLSALGQDTTGSPPSLLTGRPRPDASPSPEAVSTPKPKRYPVLVIIFILVLLVSAAGVLFWIFGLGRKNPTPIRLSLPAKSETTLEFNNGDSLKGEIESETEAAIVFKIEGGTVTFLKNEIRRIVRPDQLSSSASSQ